MFVEREYEGIQQIIDETVDDCNQVCKAYKLMCDENKILKDILYNSYEKGISPKVRKLTNYHPLINSKERNDKQINLMRMLYTKNSGNNLLAQFEGIFGLIFDLIEYIFCIKRNEKYIQKFYNDHTLESFRSIAHCIKLMFLCTFIFLPFNIISFVNNYDSLSEYGDDYFAFGYLSFSRKPEDNKLIVKIYVVSLVIYLTVFFSYVLFLHIQKYLSGSESNFIDSNYPLSKFIFTSPTIRINNESEKKFYQNFIIKEILNITDHLYKMPKRSLIINITIFLINFILIISNMILVLFINKVSEELEKIAPNNNHLKVLFNCFFQALISNFFPILVHFLIRFHVDIVPETVEKLKFWLPFFSKSSTYTITLLTNFNIFMGNENSFLSKFSPKFKDTYKCKEDNAANNLIEFMIIEFLLRKLFSFFFNLCTYKMNIKFSLEFLIINVMCKFYIMNMITLIFPAQGFFSTLLFFIEYRIEIFVLKRFRTSPMTIQNSESYKDYSVFCLTLNLLSMIIINIIFQNQFNIIGNLNEKKNLPILCTHAQKEHDFFYVFNSILGDAFKAAFESVNMFIFLPSLIVIYQILVNSKALINRYSSSLKFLLRMITDENPNYMFEKINHNKDILIKKFDEYDSKKNEIVRLSQTNKKPPKISTLGNDEGEDDVKVGL